ncbi:TonB-dependent receptor [Persicobacter diffluens]|uniref:TonB-dependent receptor n=1 Tax=Persicobacter diffluens TaxID=981 RepID=A0AAN5AID0_9BACT|nr:TonB-dependent receptor [Persicobacter diffluens]
MKTVQLNVLNSTIIRGTILLLMLCGNVRCWAPVYAQSAQMISGHVVDENGQEMPGVTVMISGTTQGTITNLDGGFELTTALPTNLHFSYVGYADHDLTVSSADQSLQIQLDPTDVKLNDVVILGSRNANRALTETPVPVDIIALDEVTNSTGQMDLSQLLQFAVPSFNSNRQAGSDGSDHIDAATLRGMGPDQVLILVNGKRRHTSSYVNLLGTRGRGAVATDLNTIPVSSIERIEVLRDGAAAQYGSDAIAGVINIVLKKQTGAGSLNAGTGITQEGDGENLMVSGNYGWKAGKDGFVNASVEINKRGMTDRAPEGEMRVIGDADVLNIGTMLNAEFGVSEKTSIYAFGGFNYRDALSGAWGREANDPERNIQEIYPNGFVPYLASEVIDNSLAFGVNSEWKGWKIDLGNAFGYNQSSFDITKTLNASLGPDSPTSFYAGKFQYASNTTNLDLTKFYPSVMEGLNIAFGSAFRVENYQIHQGEEASWKNYGYVDSEGNVKAGGAQGYPGFRPENEVNESRNNIGGYVDVELDLTEKFMIGTAVRAEHYSDFGSTVTGKIVSRYSPVEMLSIRGAVSTGFRAPSLQQAYYNSTYTDFVGGVAQDVVLARNDSEVAKALGIPELKEEQSQNYSLGMTLTPVDGLTITLDGYQINVYDRVVVTGYFDSEDPDVGHILQEQGVDQVAFFTNAVDTKTYGFDFVTTYTTNIGQDKLTASLAVNHNVTEVTAVHTSDQLAGKEDIYFGERERLFYEGSAPKWKGNVMLNYQHNKWSAMIRANYFGQVTLGTWTGDGMVAVYDPKTTTDVSFSYHPTDKWNFTLGGSNIFNVYPDKQDPYETDNGGYWDPVQMGFNGAYWYSKVSFNF